MKIVQINAVCSKGSTGKICLSVSKLLDEKNIENYIIYSGPDDNIPNAFSCAGRPYIKLQALKSHIFGNYGFNSYIETKKIISKLNEINPDIVHLHNLHGHNCNLKMLFEYFKQNKTRLFWTFHDCWAFTGYCPHYDMIGCDKWQTECKACPQHKEFSFLFDKSNLLFKTKKELFSGLDLTIITPSQWLADEVKKSFLKDYPVKVINNGIDLETFRFTDSDFKEKHNLSGKYIVLGVAFGWGVRKGLDVFVNLANKLDSNKYQIVLVGTDDSVDKQLPHNIISIHRTHNQTELAKIYSAADVLVNPTREENFPTVNLESLACGTPVVCFDTGGCKEMLSQDTGIFVPKNDETALLDAITRVCESDGFTKENCLEQVKGYKNSDCFNKYVDLYM